MADSTDLIAYLEQRRRARWRALRTAALLAVATLLLILAITAFLHAAGVGSHTQTTLHVTLNPARFHITRTQVGGVPILP